MAVARTVFGPAMNIQAPPNLSAGALSALIAAGISDWGGVSPVTPDHVNPERPWPGVAEGRYACTGGTGSARMIQELQRWTIFLGRMKGIFDDLLLLLRPE